LPGIANRPQPPKPPLTRCVPFTREPTTFSRVPAPPAATPYSRFPTTAVWSSVTLARSCRLTPRPDAAPLGWVSRTTESKTSAALLASLTNRPMSRLATSEQRCRKGERKYVP
jgi:hypothetical protein